uniref:Envelope protein n=1 Tax=Caenorhabditis tropicalis TaxID=1561998 RepID=A0A1I7TBQ2_9PELO
MPSNQYIALALEFFSYLLIFVIVAILFIALIETIKCCYSNWKEHRNLSYFKDLLTNYFLHLVGADRDDSGADFDW